MSRWIGCLPIGMLLASAWGCAACDCAPVCETCCPAAKFHCEEVEPQVISANLSLLPERLPPVAFPSRYCLLTELQAQCLAAQHSQLGNLFVKESQAVADSRKCFDRGSELASQLLALEARQKRNEDAANSLEVFYRILEAEAGSQNILLRMEVVDAMLADIGRLRERGMLAPVSRNEIDAQRLELLHKQTDVHGTLEKLNRQLASLIGTELSAMSRFWPEADLTIAPDVPAAETSVQTAFANRADLKALRIAANADDRETLAAARVLLAPLGLGSSGASPGCLQKLMLLCHGSDEAATRSEQLRMAYRYQQRTIRSETESAVAMVQTRLTQVGLTRERLQVSFAHLKASEQQQQAIPGSVFSLRKIRLELLAVEQDLLHDVIEWKLATMKLRAAQGLLAEECGF